MLDEVIEIEVQHTESVFDDWGIKIKIVDVACKKLSAEEQ